MKTNLATLQDSGKSKIQMIHGRGTRSSIIVDVSYVAAILILNTSRRLTTGPGNNGVLCVLWLSQRRECHWKRLVRRRWFRNYFNSAPSLITDNGFILSTSLFTGFSMNKCIARNIAWDAFQTVLVTEWMLERDKYSMYWRKEIRWIFKFTCTFLHNISWEHSYYILLREYSCWNYKHIERV